MRSLLVLMGFWIALASAPGCDSKPPVPKAYRSEPGNFQVDMPGSPKVNEKSIDTALGPLPQTFIQFFDNVRNTAHDVSYTEYPESFIRTRDAAAILEGSLSGLAEDKKWTIHKTLPIKLGVHEGIDIWADYHVEDGTILTSRRRYYVIGTRLYTVSALVPEAGADREAMDKYVASFRLLREKKQTIPKPAEADVPSGQASTSYRSEPGNFQVDMPGQPTVTEKTIESAQGPLPQTFYLYNDAIKNTTHTVVYTEYPEPFIRSRNAETILESALNGLAKNKKWTIRKTIPIKLDSHVGLDAWAAYQFDNGTTGTYRRRSYIVGTRMYTVSVLVPETGADLEAMERFVASFHLLRDVPNLSPPSEAAAPAEPTSKDPETSPK